MIMMHQAKTFPNQADSVSANAMYLSKGPPSPIGNPDAGSTPAGGG
jgi:hypothetical protein